LIVKKRRIHILTPDLVPYDAIGNDVTQMREALLEHGYAVRIFAEGIHPRYAAIAEPLSNAPDHLWQSPEDLLIYHHSTAWGAGETILFKTKNRILIRYHNVTPPHFFSRYSIQYHRACAAGLEATRRIARLRNIDILGASSFNCNDLIALGAPVERCRVLPPLHLTEQLGQEPFDIPTIQLYSGEMVNILFVGGIKPNKGHIRAIRAFAKYYHQFNSRSRLIFAGGTDNRLRSYTTELRRLAAGLGLNNQVIFTGSITGAELKSLYVSADVFLSASEHEGFCVPLIEAMYFRVPVLAWGKAAVPETMGGCGFVLNDWDELQVASHIGKIATDSELANHLGDLGRIRYRDLFSSGVLRKSLCDTIAGLAEGSRAVIRLRAPGRS
jgi:glycosyltransferase involved in cell wall biosynthesis